MTADGRIDRAAGNDHPGNDGFVDAAHRACLQLGDQVGMGLQGLGHHHESGGVLVQAMDDAGTRHAVQRGYVVQQGIEQGAVGMAGGRMHHQPGGLVEHQQVIVFVDDVQLDVLGHPLALGLALGAQRQLGAAMDGVTRTQHGAVDGQAAVLDPGGETRAGVFGEQLGSDLIEALATEFVGDFGIENDGFGHGSARAMAGLLESARPCG